MVASNPRTNNQRQKLKTGEKDCNQEVGKGVRNTLGFRGQLSEGHQRQQGRGF